MTSTAVRPRRQTSGNRTNTLRGYPRGRRPTPRGRRPRRVPWPTRTGRWARHHKARTFLLLLGTFLAVTLWSLGSALTDPANGVGTSARLSEWLRGHGGGSVVTWAENLWYSHHPPPVGGAPAPGAIPPASASPSRVLQGPGQLPVPAPVTPFASPATPGEGTWHPVGRLVGGVPAVYETFLRPDAVHTSVVTGVAYMDTRLLSATLYSGSAIPGGGPWQVTAPISAQASQGLVVAFNAGFRMADANGGYYTQGQTVVPLRTGAASFVISRDGTARVGRWGRDVSLTPDVVSVRQNLDLLVDGGQPVPGLQSNDTHQWGSTLGGQVFVWRSGVGVTADGALVYVAGPNLNITDLADVLARAGAVRAMELDINSDWVNLATYDPGPAPTPATPASGTNLLPAMVGTPARYFQDWWTRDFFTMSARPTTGR